MDKAFNKDDYKRRLDNENKIISLFAILSTLSNRLCSMTKSFFLLLHAAAVMHNDHAFIFAASTGSGKTTLAAFLSESGYAFISDDEVQIDMSSLRVHSEPAPLQLRVESVPVLNKYGIDITIPITETESFRRIVYLPENHVSGDIPIGGLFFIQRSEIVNSYYPVPAGKAVQLIIQNLLSPDIDMSACLHCAIKLVPKCRRLVYSDMNYVREILKNE